mgnify:CR=1 FL=1
MAKQVGKKKLSIDFGGVQSGGGRAVPDGDYQLEVEKVTEEESSEGNPYLKWIYTVTDGLCKGAKIYDNTSLLPQALWRLKTLLECLGVDVPDSSLSLDLGEMVGLSVEAEIVNETYQGKTRPKISGFQAAGGQPATSTQSDEDEDERPAKGKKTKGPSFKVGAKVSFKDEDDKVHKGTITAIEDDQATVDVKGEEWELDIGELSAI